MERHFTPKEASSTRDLSAHTEPNPGGARLLSAKADTIHASCHIRNTFVPGSLSLAGF